LEILCSEKTIEFDVSGSLLKQRQVSLMILLSRVLSFTVLCIYTTLTIKLVEIAGHATVSSTLSWPGYTLEIAFPEMRKVTGCGIWHALV
jgi:hypothetical protein